MPPLSVCAVVSDLFLRAKVQEVLRSAGCEHLCVSSIDALAAQLALTPAPDLVLVDLGLREADLFEKLATLVGPGRPRIVGFVSHMDEATAAKARTAGLDAVMPRSAFFRDLPEMAAQATRKC